MAVIIENDSVNLPEQGSAPATPGTGRQKLYFGTDGYLYAVDDVGSAVRIQPTSDQATALDAYQAALAVAAAGQVLTASGPGAAAFAAAAGGGPSLYCDLPVIDNSWRGDNASSFAVPIDTNWHTLAFSGIDIPGVLFVRLEIYVQGATGVFSVYVRPGGLTSDTNGVLIGKGVRSENNPIVQFASVPSNNGTIDVKISSIPSGGSALIIFGDLIAAIVP